MVVHLMRDLDDLRQHILQLGSMVEEAVDRAVVAFLQRDVGLADEVASGDDSIDRMEVKIEEDCLKLLALHHPVAADLRYIVMVLKVNNDFERIGDLAVNVAERAHFLALHPPLTVDVQFEKMAATVRQMIQDSLNAMVGQDIDLARQVCEQDEVVDRIHRHHFKTLEDAMRKDPGNVERAVQMLSASRYMERMADQTTNVAEDVIFQVQGDVVRHDASLGRPK